MKIIGLVVSIFLLAGCNMTSYELVQKQPTQVAKRIQPSCAQQAFARSQSALSDVSAFIATAENAQACLGSITFSPSHPDNHLALQLQALAVNNYVQAGDIASARLAFSEFRQKFPMQDLVYPDFTSFVDTATALLEHDSLSPHQLARLNINPQLKAELSRQQRWAMQ